MRLRLLALLVLPLAWAGPVRGQAVKSPADVLPATTLLYADVRQPGAFAKEIGALLRGSALGDLPGSLYALRGQPTPDAALVAEEISVMGSLFSEEVVREAGRIRGAAVALTGVSKDGLEYVAVILSGESNAPAFVMRMFLVNERSTGITVGGRRVLFRRAFEPVATVEGVRLYRKVERRPDAKSHTRGPAVAMMPGAVLLGSPAAVTDVIRRIKGKGEGETLASVKTYQELSGELGKGPGLFAYANPAPFLDAVAKLSGERDRPVIELFNKVVNPKAMRASAASLSLDKGTLIYRKVTLLDPAEKSPLLEVFPSAPLKTDLLHFAPRDALLFAALSNNDGAKRWKRFLDLADTIVRATNPRAPLPSQHVEEMEGVLKINLGKDVAGKIRAAAVAMPGPKRLTAMMVPRGKKSPPAPFVFILRATDTKAAEELAQKTLLKVVAALAHEEGLEPTIKEVDGQKISTLTVRGHAPICYGRQGSTLVLGFDAGLVAEALNGGAKEGGLLADEKVAVAVKRLDGPVLLGLLKPVSLAAFLGMSHGSSKPKATTETRPSDTPVPPAKPIEPRRERKSAERPKPPPRKGPPRQPADVRQMLMALLEKEEPMVLSVTRKPNRIDAELRYSGLRRIVPRLIDVAILERAGRRASTMPPTRPVPTPPPPREK